VKANQTITIKEGAGIVSAAALKHSGTR
jgi:hypothetical protein